jgi:hypothetical protein
MLNNLNQRRDSWDALAKTKSMLSHGSLESVANVTSTTENRETCEFTFISKFNWHNYMYFSRIAAYSSKFNSTTERLPSFEHHSSNVGTHQGLTSSHYQGLSSNQHQGLSSSQHQGLTSSQHQGLSSSLHQQSSNQLQGSSSNQYQGLSSSQQHEGLGSQSQFQNLKSQSFQGLTSQSQSQSLSSQSQQFQGLSSQSQYQGLTSQMVSANSQPTLMAVHRQASVRASAGGYDPSDVSATVTGPYLSSLPCSVTGRAGGELAVNFVPKDIGEHVIELKVGETRIGGSPIR